MTEADTPGAAALDVSEKCLHARPLCAGRMSSGLMPLGGLAPVRGGVTASSGDEDAGIKRKEGHLVDALALRGDEGRGTLRKARMSREQALTPGSPNGATHPQGYPQPNP